MATVRAAAIQLDSVIGDIDENLSRSERLADAAGAVGADWIVLPEFFTTGMGFAPALNGTALPPDGIATDLLLRLAKRHDAKICAADGKLLAFRSHLDGPGFILADVEIGSVPPLR